MPRRRRVSDPKAKSKPWIGIVEIDGERWMVLDILENPDTGEVLMHTEHEEYAEEKQIIYRPFFFELGDFSDFDDDC